MTTDPTTDRPRALHLLEAADFLRDAHFRDGLSMQEAITALRHMADEVDPMAGSLARDGFGLDEIAAMPAAPVAAPPTGQAGLRERIAGVLRPHANLGGTPPRYELPLFDGATPSLPRISGWWALDDVVAAVMAMLRGLTLRELELLHRPNTTPSRPDPYRTTSEPHRLALSTALGLGTGAPWDAIRERAAELAGQGRAGGRAAWWREAADECDTAGAAYTARAQNDHAAGAFALMETFLRKANEAEYVATPCDFAACEPGGEPCSVHERLMAHAEGDHELCAPDCGTPAAETPGPETQGAHDDGASDAEPSEEQIVREHVTTLHLIGEQLAAVESWMWAHLADVRATAPAVAAEPGKEA